MKNKIKQLYIAIFLLVPLLSPAQVGIVTIDPKSTLDVVALSITGNRAEGIIAPNLTRAQLISKDSKYTSLQIDAMVYITAIDGVVTGKTANVTRVGYYYFDGSVWQKVDKSGQYFYLPTFMLPITAIGTGLTFDIYNNVYKKQFDKSVNTRYIVSNGLLTKIPAVRYAATELDYVITHYDTEVMRINSISASGIINYDVLSTVLGPGSFVNIMLITK